jgi:hypothetical protein
MVKHKNRRKVMVARRKIKFFDKIGVFSDKIKKKEHEYCTNDSRFGENSCSIRVQN